MSRWRKEAWEWRHQKLIQHGEFVSKEQRTGRTAHKTQNAEFILRRNNQVLFNSNQVISWFRKSNLRWTRRNSISRSSCTSKMTLLVEFLPFFYSCFLSFYLFLLKRDSFLFIFYLFLLKRDSVLLSKSFQCILSQYVGTKCLHTNS